MQISHLGFGSCELRRSGADIIFLFDLSNDFIDSLELLSVIGFKTRYNRCLRKTNLSPRTLKLANYITDHTDFFYVL